MKILNLTQHVATPEQLAAGVVDLSPKDKEFLAKELTFDDLPSSGEIKARAENIGLIPGQHGYTAALIGGAPYLMGALERVLAREGIETFYAFSLRVSAEKTLPDGKVIKVNEFKHIGFLKAVGE